MQHPIRWIDTCKLIAILTISLGHFLQEFQPALLTLADDGGPLYGIFSPRFGVALFCVAAGYLSRARMQRYHSASHFLLSRWRRLAAPIFLMSALVWLTETLLAHAGAPGNHPTALRTVFLASFFFETPVIPTFQVVSNIFAGSLLLALLHWYTPTSRREALCLCLALAPTALWDGFTAAVLAGSLLHLAEQAAPRPARTPWARAGLAAAVPPLLLAPVDDWLFLRYTLAACCVFWVTARTPWLQRVLSVRVLSWPGRRSDWIFFLHTPFNWYLSRLVLAWVTRGSDRVAPLLLSWAACTVLTFGLSYVFAPVANAMSDAVGRLFGPRAPQATAASATPEQNAPSLS